MAVSYNVNAYDCFSPDQFSQYSGDEREVEVYKWAQTARDVFTQEVKAWWADATEIHEMIRNAVLRSAGHTTIVTPDANRPTLTDKYIDQYATGTEKTSKNADIYTSPTYSTVMHALDTGDEQSINAAVGCATDNTLSTEANIAMREIAANMLMDLDQYTAMDDATLQDLKDDPTEENLEKLNAALRQQDEIFGALGLPGQQRYSRLTSAARGFKEQCFLMANIIYLASLHRTYQEQIGVSTTPGRPFKPLPTIEDPGSCILLDADTPFAFINKLTQRGKDTTITNMKTSQIASLQPKIRLFKISSASPQLSKEDSKSNSALHVKEYIQELVFDAYYGAGGKDSSDHTDLSRYLGDKNSRGQGVGIKDFTFTYEGDNPYAVKKSISAKLTIFANSFDELLRARPGDTISSKEVSPQKLDPYRIIDLALKTGKVDDPTGTNATDTHKTDLSGKLDFRLMAVVGWQQPGETLSGDLRDAINDSYITLNLTPTIHTFKFDDAGRVTFTIEYLAYIEDLFDSPYFNIFGKIEVNESSMRRKLKYKVLNEECKYDEVQAMKLEDGEAAEGEKLEKDIRMAREALMGMMFNRSKKNKNGVLTTALTWDKMLEFIKNGPFAQYSEEGGKSNFEKSLPLSIWSDAPATTDIDSRDEYIKPPPAEFVARSDGITIPFFYVSDLIDAILTNINNSFRQRQIIAKKLKKNIPKIPGKPDKKITTKYKWFATVDNEIRDLARFKEEFQRFRLILGPIEFYNAKTGDSHVINLGDIPVSMRYFGSWLSDQMGGREYANYNLPRFLSDFFNQFIRDYLNNDSCFASSYRQRVRLSQNVLTGYGDYVLPRTKIEMDKVVAYIMRAQTSAQENPDNLVTMTRAVDTVNASISAVPAGRASIAKYDVKTNGSLLNSSGPKGDPRQYGSKSRQDQYNYMIFSAGRVQPKEQLNGDKTEDEENGIFHYAIGRDRGLTKKIDLQRTSMPSLAALRFEREGFDGLLQLRETYDATIMTFANVKAVPGAYVYVDPKGFAPSTWGHTETNTGDANFDLTHLGIGGYYMIKRSTHSFGAGYADSSIDAVWVAETHADGKSATEPLEDENAAQSPIKCRIKPQEK